MRGKLNIHVIMVAYERYIPLEIAIRSFLIQSSPNWVLHIVYDGKAPQRILDIISLVEDKRIHFYESEERYQNYGHPNRKTMLQTIETNPGDFILMTNDDNYYVPVFVEYMLNAVRARIGIIYCNTVHSHMGYDIHYSELREQGIDMGAFMVREDIAKQTGFNHIHFSADGAYAGECLQTCIRYRLKTVKVNKALFIHN